MDQYAYIEFTFSKSTEEYLNRIVQEAVQQEDLYYSDVVSRIKGNVTENAHFTLFYGLKPTEIDNLALQDLVSNIEIRELQLGKLALFDGYKGLYKILSIEVLDNDRYLTKILNKVLDFEHNEELGQREFKPHITLAYVQQSYELPKNYLIENKKISVEKIQLKL